MTGAKSLSRARPARLNRDNEKGTAPAARPESEQMVSVVEGAGEGGMQRKAQGLATASFVEIIRHSLGKYSSYGSHSIEPLQRALAVPEKR